VADWPEVESAEPPPVRPPLGRYERWFAQRFIARWAVGPGAIQDRMRDNHGPDGLLLLGAAYSMAVLGVVAAIAGLVLIAVSGGHEPVLTIGAGFVVGALLALAAATGRGWPARRAARRYRAGRPYVWGRLPR
jgi:hypothetical protein